MGIKSRCEEARALLTSRCGIALAMLFLIMCAMGCAESGGRFTEVRELGFQTVRDNSLAKYLRNERDAELFPDRVTTVHYNFEDVWGGVQAVLNAGKDKIVVCDAKQGLIITDATRKSIVIVPFMVKYYFLIQEKSPGLTTISYRFILHVSVDSKSRVVYRNGIKVSDTSSDVWEPVRNPSTILFCQTSIEAKLAREISNLPPAEISSSPLR